MRMTILGALIAAGSLALPSAAPAYIVCPQGIAGKACGSAICDGTFTQLFNQPGNVPRTCACVCKDGTIVNAGEKDSAASGAAASVGAATAAPKAKAGVKAKASKPKTDKAPAKE